MRSPIKSSNNNWGKIQNLKRSNREMSWKQETEKLWLLLDYSKRKSQRNVNVFGYCTLCCTCITEVNLFVNTPFADRRSKRLARELTQFGLCGIGKVKKTNKFLHF